MTKGGGYWCGVCFCIYLYIVTYLHLRLISYKIGCQGEAQGQLNWGLPTTKPYCDAMHHP
jgi:hypothetical protein